MRRPHRGPDVAPPTVAGPEQTTLARRRSAREAGLVVGERTWWCVVAMLGPIRVGSRHARADWPAHVTLAGNHRVDDPSALPALVDDALRDVGVLAPRLGRMEWFGPDRDVPVLLVASASIELAHERLAKRLDAVPGFGAEEPRHWRTGYRPHLTLDRTSRSAAPCASPAARRPPWRASRSCDSRVRMPWSRRCCHRPTVRGACRALPARSGRARRRAVRAP